MTKTARLLRELRHAHCALQRVAARAAARATQPAWFTTAPRRALQTRQRIFTRSPPAAPARSRNARAPAAFSQACLLRSVPRRMPRHASARCAYHAAFIALLLTYTRTWRHQQSIAL